MHKGEEHKGRHCVSNRFVYKGDRRDIAQKGAEGKVQVHVKVSREASADLNRSLNSERVKEIEEELKECGCSRLMKRYTYIFI